MTRRSAAPKANEVISLLRYFPEEIEADLQRFYGVDIGDWWRGDLSSRRLFVFLEQLPEDASLFRARFTGDRWTETQHMLANLIDQVTFMRREAQGEESNWTPKALPRPNEAETKQDEQAVMNAVHDGLLAMMSKPE